MDEKRRRLAVTDDARTAGTTDVASAADVAAAAYRDHADVIYRCLARACGNADDAEEAVQEAFLRFHQEVSAGREIVHARAWAFRVARNELLKRVEKREHESVAWTGLTERLIRRAARRRPDQDVLRNQVLEAARRLPIRQRVIVMARLEGWRFREIGETLRKTPAQVAKLYERALQTLRREIGEPTR